ncbi:MAG: hypothetical protein ACRD29_09865 [Acidimicrobiales bacterium]
MTDVITAAQFHDTGSIGRLGVDRHVRSVATTTLAPETTVTRTSASKPVVVPYESIWRAMPCWPRHPPSRS